MKPTKNDKKLAANLKINDHSLSREIEGLLNELKKTEITSILTMNKNAQIIMSNWAHNIVNQYHGVLKTNPMKLKDITELPASKMDVKLAIKLLLLASVEKGLKDKTVVDLRDKFISLGAFQSIDQKDQLKLMKHISDIQKKSAGPDATSFPGLNKYMDLIISEQKVLLEEINNFIDDLRKIKKKV